MRVKLNQERLGIAKHYGASSTMTLALATLYGIPQSYKTHRRRFTAFMAECVAQVPPDNKIQARLRELCPSAKRVRLYISEWGMLQPSHYVILHRVTPPDVFRLGCARLLVRDSESVLDGVTITWPSNNPEIACGQSPTLMSFHSSGASISLESEELQRELRLSVETMWLYNNQSTVSVWGHPGKTVVEITPETINIVRVCPHAPNVTKFNVILWGDVSSDLLVNASPLPRHIVPQIKDATPYAPVDALESNMLKWALETRLLPYIAISHTTQRGDIFALTYDPEIDDCFIACIATNHKIVGLPRIIRLDSCYAPDLVLAERLKTLFLKGSHVNLIRGLLYNAMGYKTWDDLILAFNTWGLPLSIEEEEKFNILKAEL